MTSQETMPTPETMSLPVDSEDEPLDGEWIQSPVDDATYNLLMALTSKLEAIDVYRAYAEASEARFASRRTIERHTETPWMPLAS
jgi:hypothetical protein